jgi:hypothetical protein
MITPEGTHNISFVGHTDQGGRGDGVQVMVNRAYAYVGTRVSRGRHGHRRARPAQSRCRRDPDLDRPLGAAPRGSAGQHRLRKLAQRRPDDPGRQGPREYVADRSPQLVSPLWRGTHSALPLHDRVVGDEATLNIDQEQMKRTWIFDIREKSDPVSIATMPTPSDQDYVKLGGQFGPHYRHGNRPGSFRSSTTIFATWQSAGVRVFDIAAPYRALRKSATSSHLSRQPGWNRCVDDAGLYSLQWNGARA